MDYSKYCAVVIGSGIAGLYSALKIQQLCQQEVLLITKSELSDSNSYYAQGGMVAVLENNKDDNVNSHVQDTLKAGAGLSEEETVRFISENSDKVVKDLLTFGVDFDRDDNGNFKLTKEAAHSVRRILHSGGDATGREMEISLCNAVTSNPKIILSEHTMATELLVKNGQCYGVKVLKNKKLEVIFSNAIIVATGGIGQIYKYTTNPIGATGDGLALCYNAGAILRDMEFVQFHPTALAIDDKINHNRFLISEAVRGEGAKLCDIKNFYYMKDYDEREELAPRDIVARANFTQMRKTNSKNVYLDATSLENPLKRFPTIAKKCLENGIDISQDLIPVAPAAHYFMGGVKTDNKGQTSIKNLYAVGEVASTGLHGANRLASNSLLECVVCAYEIAKNLENIDREPLVYELQEIEEVKNQPISNALEQRLKLKNLMWENVGIYRDEISLSKALKEIEEFDFENKCNSVEEYELQNMYIVAKLVVLSALKRQESRGGHYRTDFLQTDEKPQHSEIIKGEKIYA